MTSAKPEIRVDHEAPPLYRPKIGKQKGKTKDPVPALSSVPNKDILQRMNFLYQSSVYLASICSPFSEPQTVVCQSGASKKLHTSLRCNVSTHSLSREYVRCLKNVGKKSVTRMDPNVKRTICKTPGCDTVLIPGLTVQVRVKSSRSNKQDVSWFCNNCRTQRRIPAPVYREEDDGSVGMDVDNVPPPVDEPGSSDVKAMAVDANTEVEAPTSRARKRKRRRRSSNIKPRLPPLFARTSAGHVVFRGDTALPDGSGQDGIWVTWLVFSIFVGDMLSNSVS
ncbi:Rpr2-domain-containing protein [Fistulina hepatica ATCC 64428]|uniref:Rpr2-domain-containing protein n=1 Tax=Fistulina hepatica ATCC 64428 TaxID=1128425 RepID=A0A0D7AQ74_9AGAR|nr:Rpr2-domain-containing protein [Fistulina hepatica ATCC 64428]